MRLIARHASLFRAQFKDDLSAEKGAYSLYAKLMKFCDHTQSNVRGPAVEAACAYMKQA